jgi:hypothetical protein
MVLCHPLLAMALSEMKPSFVTPAERLKVNGAVFLPLRRTLIPTVVSLPVSSKETQCFLSASMSVVETGSVDSAPSSPWF